MKNLKRLGAVIMSVIMLLGVVPATALADEPSAPAEGTVKAEKKLLKDENGNYEVDPDGNYTVQISIESVPYKMKTEANADVVLVVDNSGSMDSSVGIPCTSTGTEIETEANRSEENDILWVKAYRCPECGALYYRAYTWNTIPVGVCPGEKGSYVRIDTAKEVSKEFAESILKDESGNKTNNKLSVIGFSHKSDEGGANDRDAVKIYEGLTDNLTSINSKIDKMKANGGTNYSAALKKAYDELNNRKDKTRPAYVIFISDGAPGLRGESIGKKAWDGSKQAKSIKDSGAELYTIGIALSDSDGAYLKSLASDSKKEHYINVTGYNYKTQLSEVLKKWASKINSKAAGKNATITDVVNITDFNLVSDSVQFAGEENTNGSLTLGADGKTITWTMAETPETKTAIQFKVKPRDGKSGTLYTNENVTLTYTDSKSNTQVVVPKEKIGHPSIDIEPTIVQPTVRDVAAALKKTVDELDTAETFTFTVKNATGTEIAKLTATVSAANTETPVTVASGSNGTTELANGTYTISEDTKDGWNAIADIRFTVANGVISFGNNDDGTPITSKVIANTKSQPEIVNPDADDVLNEGVSKVVESFPTGSTTGAVFSFKLAMLDNEGKISSSFVEIPLTATVGLTDVNKEVAMDFVNSNDKARVLTPGNYKIYEVLEANQTVWETPNEIFFTVNTNGTVVFTIGNDLKEIKTIRNTPVPKDPEVTGITKELIKSAEDIPAGVSGITLPNDDDVVIIPAGDNATVTLLYKITVTGDEGANFTVVDEDATAVAGTSLSGEIPTGGEAVIYVTKTFKGSDIKDKTLSNTASISGNDDITDTEVVGARQEQLYSITVSKKVEGLDTTTTNPAFKFSIHVEGATPNTEIKTSGSAFTLGFDDNGDADFELKDGDSITIVGIPEGASYTVMEESNDDFVTDVDGATEDILSEDVVIEFINTFKVPETKYFKLTYYDGSTALKEETYEEKEVADLTKYTPTKEGYDFVGWLDRDGTIVESIYMSSDKVVHALWKEKEQEPEIFTLTYYDGETVLRVEEYEANTVVDLGKYTPSKEGYIFKGWTDVEGKAVTTVTMDSDKAVYAKWEEVEEDETTYILTYYDDDVVLKTEEYTDGETVSLSYVPTKSGYTFVGWYDEELEDEFENVLMDANKAVYAKWKKNSTTSGGGNGKTIINAKPTVEDLNKEDHFAYIVGQPNGYVYPDKEITRAEVATIFFRLLKEDARKELWTKTNPYPDVNLDDWFNVAVSVMSNGDVVHGYPDGTFKPNNTITRAEFATMAAQFLSSDYVGDSKFSDIDAHWAAQYINRAAAEGWISGYPDGTFKPDQNITRAEAMTLINAVLERTPDKNNMLDDMITWPDNLDTGKWYYAQVQEATNSHEYERKDTRSSENWTAILPVRDWAEIERSWSDIYSATNPGDVMD